MLDQHEEVQPVVFQSHLEALHDRLIMQIVLLVYVYLQAPSCEVLLLVREPGCRGGIIWQYEAGQYGQSYSDGSFLVVVPGQVNYP